MESMRMDSGSSAFGTMARSTPFSSLGTADMAAMSSSSGEASSSGGLRSNMTQRCGARIQTRIPGLHSCVVRLRAEDQHLAEDIIEGLEFARDRAVMNQLASHVNDILITSPKRSNPSPLGSSARGTSPLVMLQC